MVTHGHNLASLCDRRMDHGQQDRKYRSGSEGENERMKTMYGKNGAFSRYMDILLPPAACYLR